MGKFINLTGYKFSRLTILEYAGKNKWGNHLWKCQCNCGNITVVRDAALKNKNIKSCGCLRNETASKLHRLDYGLAAAHYVFDSLKRNATKRGYAVEITFEEALILFKQSCYYCGLEPRQVRKNRKNNGDFIYNGIDRIDNTKGYILDNCVSCCKHCNWCKKNLTTNEFKEWLIKIYKHFIEDKYE